MGEAPKRRDPRGSLPPSPVTVPPATVPRLPPSPRPPSPSPRPPSPSPPSRRPPQEADPVQLNGGAPPWTPVLLLGERRAALHGRSGRLGGAAGTALHLAPRPLPPVPVGGTRRRLAESCAKGRLRRGPWARPPEPACHRHAEQCQRNRELAAASGRAGTRRASCWDRPGPAVGTRGSLGERRGGRALQASLRARGRHRHRPQGCKRTWLSRGTGRGAGIPDADPTLFLAETARSRVPWNPGCSSVTERGPRGPAS